MDFQALANTGYSPCVPCPPCQRCTPTYRRHAYNHWSLSRALRVEQTLKIMQISRTYFDHPLIQAPPASSSCFHDNNTFARNKKPCAPGPHAKIIDPRCWFAVHPAYGLRVDTLRPQRCLIYPFLSSPLFASPLCPLSASLHSGLQSLWIETGFALYASLV